MGNNGIFVYWDESRIWGLMLTQALEAFGIEFRLVNSQDIKNNILAQEKNGLLLVPGGSARKKGEKLGSIGLAKLRAWINDGGNYLGICGGAGLGLSSGDGNSLGICPWNRAAFSKRSSHFFSGHVKAELPGRSVIKLPVWWPGRFEAGDTAGINILVRYQSPCRDLFLGDEPYMSQIGKAGTEKNAGGEFPAGQPLAIAGKYGKGTYVLSYAHPETPQSRQANNWLKNILEKIFGIRLPEFDTWEWNIFERPWKVHDSNFAHAMYKGFQEIFALMENGVKQKVFFSRCSWLYGWREGYPGITYNCLLAAFAFLAMKEKNNAEKLWRNEEETFNNVLKAFLKASEMFNQALENGGTLINDLETLKREIFGHPVLGGGLAGDLLDMLDKYVFLHYQKIGSVPI